jgi:putative transposase
MQKVFMYLTAIIDVYSRFILGWGLSNLLDAASFLNAVKKAVDEYVTPTILNSDQVNQLTYKESVDYLKSNGIQISMDLEGRALDNIYLLKYFGEQ